MKPENLNTNPELNKSNKTGRERKYDAMRAGDLEKLQKAIDNYFIRCWGNTELTDAKDFKVPPTVLGLALAVGLEKANLYEMVKRQDLLSIPVKKALEKIQDWTELQLFTNPRQIGVLFSLKNNYGWKDKQELDTNVTGNITVSFGSNPSLNEPEITDENEEGF